MIAQPKKGKGGRRDSVDRGGVHYDSDDSMASVELTGEQRDAQVARGLTVAPSFKVLSMHQLRSHMDSGNPMGSMDSLESMRRGAGPLDAFLSFLGLGETQSGERERERELILEENKVHCSLMRWVQL